MNSTVFSQDLCESWQGTATLLSKLLQMEVCAIVSVSQLQVEGDKDDPKTMDMKEWSVVVEVEENHSLSLVNCLSDAIPVLKKTLQQVGVLSLNSSNLPCVIPSVNYYLGHALHWPDGSVFGALILMDSRSRPVSSEQLGIFSHLHSLTESQLALVYERAQHEQAVQRLECYQFDTKALATRDTLTGAYSQGALIELAVAELSRSTRKSSAFVLVQFEVDGFERLRSVYGQVASEEVLRVLVTSMTEWLRQSDFIARMNADRFCLLLPEMEPTSVFSIIDRLRARIKERVLVFDNTAIHYSASFGCAAFEPGMITTVDELLQMAQQALLDAKQSGGNRVCVAAPDASEENVLSEFN